jgi:AcrR family transcriptional regulator
MTVRSRADAQAETRELLLDAAERCFAAEGFAGASLDRIAEAAGFTRGAVYSNFADKAELFATVIDRRLDRRAAQIGEALLAAGGAEAYLAAVHDPAQETAHADEVRRWILLRDEFRLFALRNPSAAGKLAAHDKRTRDSYAQAITYLLDQLGVELPIDLGLAAAILVAVDEGLSRQHLLHPDDVPETALADAHDFLLRAVTALWGTTSSLPRRTR